MVRLSENTGGLKPRIAVNMFWKFAERMGSQVISVGVSIVLARLLSPTEYGLIAMVTIFIAILNEFVTSGFGSALIQKKDADDLDFSTVFFFNLFLSLILYVILFFSAPIIAAFYGHEILSPVMRVLGFTVVLASINNIQQAYVSRKMIFKRFFYATLGGTLCSAVIGIIMAYKGYGIWALVAQQMVNATVNTIILWVTVKWRPRKQFSMARLKKLFSFGWKLLVAGLLNTLNNNIYQLIIGKLYSAGDLAYYNKGLQFPGLVMGNVNTTISAVIFPTLSLMQDDIGRLKEMTRKTIRISSYLCFPMMVGLASVAEPLIVGLLTDKWLEIVPYMRISCYAFAVIIMQVSIQDAINAMGRSDVFLKMDVVSKIVGLIFLISVMHLGVMIIALTSIVIGTFNLMTKVVVSKHIFGYTYKEHLADNFPILSASIFMGIPVYAINLLNFSSGITLLIQIPLGIVVYTLLSLVFKLEGFIFIQRYLKKFLMK